MAIVLPDSSLPYILFQRTDYLVLPKNKLLYRVICKLSNRTPIATAISLESRFRKGEIKRVFNIDMAQEYADIRDWLPPDASAILDVGCGIGGIDILLFHHYKDDPNLHLYLLDKSQMTDQVTYGFKDRGEFYNSLDLTREILILNGVADRSIRILEARDDGGIDIDEGLDLVISLISWGFHYPVGLYLDRVHELLKPGGRLILDVRKDTGGIEAIEAKFGNAAVISEGGKNLRLAATR